MIKEQILMNAIDYMIEHIEISYPNNNKKVLEVLCKHLQCDIDDIRTYVIDLLTEED